jgi:hypothetical protein
MNMHVHAVLNKSTSRMRAHALIPARHRRVYLPRGTRVSDKSRKTKDNITWCQKNWIHHT